MSEESKVELALRSQRDSWREIVERLSARSGRAFPTEPPKRILLFGVGSSHFAAKLSGLSVVKVGMSPRAAVISCSSMAIGTEVIPSHGDWAFGFSHRGKTASTLKALQLCHQVGAFTVLVSGKDAVADAPPFVRYVLSTCALESVEPHTISVSSAICAVTTVLLGGRLTEEWLQLGELPIPGLDALRRRVGRGPTLILGEWIGEWIAHECALKLMEMGAFLFARTEARNISTACATASRPTRRSGTYPCAMIRAITRSAPSSGSTSSAPRRSRGCPRSSKRNGRLSPSR